MNLNNTVGVMVSGHSRNDTNESNRGATSDPTISEMITGRSASEQRVALPRRPDNRMSVTEVAGRLDIGRLAVYRMLQDGILPGIRVNRRWIITRHAYEEWEGTCGIQRSFTKYENRGNGVN